MQLFYIMIRTSSLHIPMYVISLDKMMPQGTVNQIQLTGYLGTSARLYQSAEDESPFSFSCSPLSSEYHGSLHQTTVHPTVLCTVEDSSLSRCPMTKKQEERTGLKFKFQPVQTQFCFFCKCHLTVFIPYSAQLPGKNALHVKNISWTSLCY